MAFIHSRIASSEKKRETRERATTQINGILPQKGHRRPWVDSQGTLKRDSFEISDSTIQNILCRKNNSIAGNFAAKEAVSKAFGTGIRGFNLIDIEILRDELGKPVVNLYGPAQLVYDTKQAKNIHVSISGF